MTHLKLIFWSVWENESSLFTVIAALFLVSTNSSISISARMAGSYWEKMFLLGQLRHVSGKNWGMLRVFFRTVLFTKTGTKPVTRSVTFVQNTNWQAVSLTSHHKQAFQLFLPLSPATDHCLWHWENYSKTATVSTNTRSPFFNQLMVRRASGASKRNTLSSCGTNREALMPRCHCQYIQTMMMFPHKYFMLNIASKTHTAWMEEETCVLSLLKGSRLKVNENKSLDANHHEG